MVNFETASLRFHEFEEISAEKQLLTVTVINLPDYQEKNLKAMVLEQLNNYVPVAYIITESETLNVWDAIGLGYDTLVQLKTSIIDTGAGKLIGHFIQFAKDKYSYIGFYLDQDTAIKKAEGLLKKELHLRGKLSLESVETTEDRYILTYKNEDDTYKVEIMGNGIVSIANKQI